MTLKIEQTPSGFSIQFPFELKSEFRTAFPKAQWNALRKCWEVGPRSGPRLEQWVSTIQTSGLLKDIETRDEQDLTAKELATLQVELNRIRAQIEMERCRKESADHMKALIAGTRALLAQEQQALAHVKHNADVADAEARKARDDTVKTLESYIKLDAIFKARDDMIRVAEKVGREAREAWDEAQAIIRNEREKLLNAGLSSEGVNALASANHNRPDRDHPRKVTLKQILALRKIKVDETT